MAMTLFSDVGDAYSRRARLYPGLIVTLPISILTVVLVTTRPTWLTAVILVIGSSGASYLGVQLVRSAGQRREERLWASWGGPPTTQLLRFAGAPNPTLVARRHAQLETLLAGTHLPDETSEAADPKRADDRYEVAVRALIEKTRDRRRFGRVFDELCQYGFRRNLWGCRTVGAWIALAGLTVTSMLAMLRVLTDLNVSVLGLTIAAGVDLLLLVTMLLVVRPEWVREAADAYASRLLGALETM